MYKRDCLSFFLSFHTHGSSSATGCLGVLSADSESPFVSKTTVGAHLEQSFDIFSQFGFQNVGGHLQVLSLFVITNSVEEPTGDALSFGIVDDIGDFVALFFIKLTSSNAGVDSQNLADEEAESATDSFDFLKSIRDCSLAIDVGVEDTMDVLEVSIRVFDDERHLVDNNLIFYIIFQ